MPACVRFACVRAFFYFKTNISYLLYFKLFNMFSTFPQVEDYHKVRSLCVKW